MIVLDTHAFLWWVADPKRLSRRSAAEIGRAERIGIPAVSCYEIAAAVSRGRIVLDRDVLEWLEQALALPSVELVPLTAPIAVKASRLEAFHGDPADRLIVATALVEDATLVSKDAKIRAYPGLNVMW